MSSTVAFLKACEDPWLRSPPLPWLPRANQDPMEMSSWVGCDSKVRFSVQSASVTSRMVVPAAQRRSEGRMASYPGMGPRKCCRCMRGAGGALRWMKKPHPRPTTLYRVPAIWSRSVSAVHVEGRKSQEPAPARSQTRAASRRIVTLAATPTTQAIHQKGLWVVASTGATAASAARA